MRLLSGIVLIFFCHSLQAGEAFCGGEVHPIDRWFEKQMAGTGGVTVDIRAVQIEAYARWEKELNSIYQSLIVILDDTDKVKLQAAQRAWVAYRDAELKWLWSQALYGNGGTTAGIAVSDISRDMLKQRVCELTRYRRQLLEGVE